MFALRVAFRYLFSKKSTNAINIISYISMAGMGVGAFALLVVLSVFNGFEGLVLSLYNSFHPDIEVTATRGKSFTEDSLLHQKIIRLDGVAAVSQVLEENVYLEYGNQSQIAVLKGVDVSYREVTSVHNYVREGAFLLHDSTTNYSVVGATIAQLLNVHTSETFEPLHLTVPRKGSRAALNPREAFQTVFAWPAGVFAIQQEFDSRYVFINLKQARELLGDEKALSAYEIKLKPGVSMYKMKETIRSLTGDEFQVKTRYEQRAETYRVMVMERWVTTAILSFIILIISFNIIGSLSMLVIEKTKDIAVLRSLGCDSNMVQRIYLFHGLLSSWIGAVSGLVLGYAFCLLQIRFHFLKLGNPGESSFVIDYYPVTLKAADPFIILFIILSISFLASWYPSRRAGQLNIAEGLKS